MLDNQHQAGTRSLADMDARIVSLNSQVHQMEENLAAKIATVMQEIFYVPRHRPCHFQTATSKICIAFPVINLNNLPNITKIVNFYTSWLVYVIGW